MTSPIVHIVIPTFNRKDITLSCVDKLLKGAYQDIKIIICDSSSKDGTQEALKENTEINVIDVGKDKWWTGAVNEGVKRALFDKSDYILIMNDDIDFSESLVQDLVNKSIEYPSTIISPLQITEHGNFLGMNYRGFFKKPNVIFSTDSSVKEIFVETSNGCCLFIPTKIFNSIGFFDENNCPHLTGDTEFQIRAQRKGFKTISTTDIIISQQKSTNYYSRVEINNIFVFFGSPVHFFSYWRFGVTLFNSKLLFVFLGPRFHFVYIKSLIKTLLYIIKRKKSGIQLLKFNKIIN